MRTHIGFSAKNLKDAIEKLNKVGFIFDNKNEIFVNVEGYEQINFSSPGLNETPAQEETPKAEEATAPKKEKASKAKKTEKVEEPKEETKPALTIEDITAAAKACHKKHGLEVLKAIIASYGAKSISEVKPEDYEAIHAELVG